MSTLVHPLPKKAVLPAPARFLRAIGFALLRTAGLLAGLILAVPVILLPFTTAVPAPVWVLLALADIVLLAVPFIFVPTSLAIFATASGLLCMSLIAIVASQTYAMTPPILGTDGKPMPGSIATLEKVNLNGSEQWITIRGKDTTKPVLLFLAGGPGGSELPFTRNVFGKLEEHFVMVNWDQPGAGKSYGARPSTQLTIDQYVADGHALTQQLRARFKQEKVYLFGESWGTVLGTRLVQQYPDLFYAYIGAGQRTSVHEDDVQGYRLAVKIAEEQGNSGLAAKLRNNGEPPYTGWDMAFKNLDYLNVLNGYARRHASGEPTGHDLFSDAITGSEYGLLDKLNWIRRLLEGFSAVYPQLDSIDFAAQAKRLDVPVYFLQGRYDLVELDGLLQDWYNVLAAPHKEIIYFENSGHTPHSWEPGKIVDVLVNKVLPETRPGH